MGPTSAPHPADALRGQRGQHLAGRVVGLGVEPGPAAPSAVRVARELLRWGAEVQPLLGPGADRWVPAAALHYAAGRAPLAFGAPRLDALLLVPGADTLRKLGLGVRDGAPLEAALALRGTAPVLLAGPEAAEGMRAVPDAFDDDGALRPEACARAACAALTTSPLRGRRVLLVAGGAAEPLDAMRTVQRLGDAGLARAAAEEMRRRGAAVTLLLGPAAGTRARHERAFDTLRDLALIAPLLGPHDLLLAEDRLPGLSPVPHAGKVPSGQHGLALELRRAPDVLPELRRHAARALVYRPSPTGLEVDGRVLPAPRGAPSALADAAEEA
jgi:phosphopantothenoylcysteine synthetase/decarboxylase